MKKTKTYWKNKCERLWKQLCKERDGHKCRYCGCEWKQLHVHHIVGRKHLRLFCDLRNGITLCSSHHKLDKMSAHENAIVFNEWIKKEIGKDVYEELKRISYQAEPLPNDWWEQEYNRLKGE